MKSLAATFVISLICNTLFSQTYVEGGIFSDTRWTKEKSPYIVTGDIVVFPSKTLHIDPGVEVKFDGYFCLEIRGTIVAVGNENDRIVFTSNAEDPGKGDWNGMPLKTEQGATADFGYCTFSYADKLNTVELCFECDAVVFAHCLFDHITTVFSDYGTRVKVDSCTFTNNTYCFTGAYKDVTHSVFTNNQYGLYETESIDVTHSTFANNGTAIYGRYCIIEGCDFYDNDVAIRVFISGIEVRGNTIENNGTGIQLSFIYGNHSKIKNNRICHNGVNVVHADDRTFELRSNCWCTSDSIEIESKLIDGYDNIQFGLFNYDIYAGDCNTWLRSVIKAPTGVESDEAEAIHIYPNPCSSTLRIELPQASAPSQVRVDILNLTGQVVCTERGTGVRFELNLEHLQPGIYMCRLKASDFTISRIILKQ